MTLFRGNNHGVTPHLYVTTQNMSIFIRLSTSCLPVSVTSRWRKMTHQLMRDQQTFDTLSRSSDKWCRNTGLFASSPSLSLFVHIFQPSGPCTIALMQDYWFYPCVFMRYSMMSVVQCSAYCQRWLRSGRKGGFIGNPPSRRLQAAGIVPMIDQSPTRLSFDRYTSIYAPRLLWRYNR